LTAGDTGVCTCGERVGDGVAWDAASTSGRGIVPVVKS